MFVNFSKFKAHSKLRIFGGSQERMKTEIEMKQVNSDYKAIAIKELHGEYKSRKQIM